MSERVSREQSIAALVHGRYLVDLPADPSGKPILFGFHGYAENAERNLEELRRIPGSEEWTLCAVQALHPFYNRTNDVVANWMTRSGREAAIRDNQGFVASVLAEVRAALGGCERWAYLGFSQGGAMAYRAAANSPAGVRAVVVLGSDLPPEVTGPSLRALPPVLLARGDREEWYTAEKMGADVERLRQAGVDVRPLHYAGGHEWTDEFRVAAGRFLAEAFAA